MEDETAMAQEDQTHNCSNGDVGSGAVGRSSKKPKQKKVPQRGLGVAQLEKIRLEEQQKRNAAAILSTPCSVPSTKSSYLPLPIHNLHHSNQPCFPMVHVSPATSSTPVPHFSIEPPSNQNYSGSGVPVRPAEKIVGMKRPYPFSLDVPPVPAFNYKLHPFVEMRTNATTACGSGNGFASDADNSNFREVPSCSASNSEPNSRKSNKESENFSGDFLTLTSPTPTSCPLSMLKSSSAFRAFHNLENPEFESPSCQGIIEDQVPPPQGYNRFNQQKQPLYCFFPPAANESQIGQTTTRSQNGNEVGDSIDLNLKL